MRVNLDDFQSIRATLMEPGVSTLFADIGIGVGLRRIILHRLSLLVASAMGVLLAVIILDVLPDAKQFLAWPALLLACSSGYFLLWLIGKYVYHVCPACAVNDLDERASPNLGKTPQLTVRENSNRGQRHEDLLARKRKKESSQEIHYAPRPMDGSDDQRCDGWNSSIVFVWFFPRGLIACLTDASTDLSRPADWRKHPVRDG